MNQNFINLMEVVTEWIEKISNEKSCLPDFPVNSVCNTANPVPTIQEIISNLKWNLAQIKHPPYLCVYRAVYGWQTAMRVWDEEGFYDVAITGMGPYGHSKKGYNTAVEEGKNWATDEQVEFRAQPYSKLEKIKEL